jgi:hypothetical protein
MKELDKYKLKETLKLSQLKENQLLPKESKKILMK